MKYENIWFDLGMTLVRPDREKLYKELLNRFNVNKSLEEIEKAYHITDKIFMRDYKHVLGTVEDEFMPWYLGVLNYNLNISLDICKLYKQYKEMKESKRFGWVEIEGARKTLLQIKNKGIKIGLISNWDNSCRQVLKKNNLLDIFDHIVISSEVGIKKPKKEIFNLAFEMGQTSAEKSIYVGDNYYDDVIGSTNVGMDCILINQFDTLGIEEINHSYIVDSINDIVKYI